MTKTSDELVAGLEEQIRIAKMIARNNSALADELAAALINTLSQLRTMTRNHPDDDINNLIMVQAAAALAKHEAAKR